MVFHVLTNLQALVYLLIIFIFAFTPTLILSATIPSHYNFPVAKPNCVDRCGNISIPYPFGTKEECYLGPHFWVTCNETTSPPKLISGEPKIEVTDISLDGQVKFMQFIAKDCYSRNGTSITYDVPSIQLAEYFTVSNTANKFTIVGCYAYADVYGQRLDRKYWTGCTATCYAKDDLIEGSCTGVGCCQTSIPGNVSTVEVDMKSYSKYISEVWDFNNCSYAFLVEESAFRFSPENLTNLYHVESLPIVVDWAIGNGTCKEAQLNSTTYACKSPNSDCYKPINGYGYRCRCLEGYQGNPYLTDGCQDINECGDASLNQCKFKEKKYCKNTQGGYTCFCPMGYSRSGEGRGKYGCNPNMMIVYVVIGVIVSVAVLFVIISWLYLKRKREKFIEMRDKFYQDNGGLTLEQILMRQGNNTLNVYRETEIIEATDNFNESNKLGEGGFGTVYKGMLRDQLVAVKKSKLSSEINHRQQIQLFVNELVVLSRINHINVVKLSRINHINVVKLLGCCMEIEIPMLVYEFIGNKTLSYHLHANNTNGTSLPWDTRLTIATEAADVLSYLHSKASPPILHRDIKTDNILLDESFTAKVADFGASTLIPLDQTQAQTLLVQATRGYLDPEFVQSGMLTEKSDVYSFGVVLAELLTRKRANFRDGAMQLRTLASYFLSGIEEGRWREIFDSSILSEENLEQLQEVANLVRRCLSMNGDDRPTMRNVFQELEKIKNGNSGAQAEMNSAEMSHSLGNQPSANQSDIEMVQTQFWSANISSSSYVPT